MSRISGQKLRIGRKAFDTSRTRCLSFLPQASSLGIPCNTLGIPCLEVTRGCRRTHLPRGVARAWRTPPRKRRRAASARHPRRSLRPRSFSRFVILHRACLCRGRIWNWHITRDAPIRNIEIFENARRSSTCSVPYIENNLPHLRANRSAIRSLIIS